MAALDTFIALRNYVKGRISDDELEESDDYISSVREDRQNRGQSEIRIEFDDERKFLENIGLHDDDIWFYQVINSPYSDYEAVDYYWVKQDFEDGSGPFYMFDDENKEKLSIISRLILPLKVDFENEEYRKKLAEKLLTNFSRETGRILDDYQTERNYEIIGTARESINEELSDFLDKLDLDIYGNGFITTVANLIMLYIRENKIHLTLKELFEEIVDKINAPGGWNDSIYEYSDDEKFDKESFNKSVSHELDKIIEILYETEEIEGVSIEEYLAMTDRVSKKFEQDKYYSLPKDPDKKARFKIEGFEYPNMKIVVVLQKGMKARKIKLSEENFYNLLYQPTLFDFEELYI